MTPVCPFLLSDISYIGVNGMWQNLSGNVFALGIIKHGASLFAVNFV